MFARKLAAGAGTFKGKVGKIDGGLIRFAATPLAFAPQGGIAPAEIGPVPWRRQLAAGLGRGGIGCESQDLVGVESHRSLSGRLI